VGTSPPICEYFLRGCCRYGNQCFNSHSFNNPKPLKWKEDWYSDSEELPDENGRDRYDNEHKDARVCQFHLVGECKFGSLCRNLHIGPSQSPKVEGVTSSKPPKYEVVVSKSCEEIQVDRLKPCGCTNEEPRFATKKETKAAAPDLLATIVASSRSATLLRLEAKIGCSETNKKRSNSVGLIFPKTSVAIAFIPITERQNKKQSPSGEGRWIVGKSPYAHEQSIASTPHFFRVYGQKEHAHCALRWLERTLGIVYLPLFNRQSFLRACLEISWGLQGYIAPFAHRMSTLPSRSETKIDDVFPVEENPWGLTASDREHLQMRNLMTWNTEDDEVHYCGNKEFAANEVEYELDSNSISFKEEDLLPCPLTQDLLDGVDCASFSAAGYKIVTTTTTVRDLLSFLSGEPDQKTSSSYPRVLWSHYAALGTEHLLDEGMTPSFNKIMRTEGAGCGVSSQLSEALSAEFLSKTLGAHVTHCEMEVEYVSKACSRLDYLCSYRLPRLSKERSRSVPFGVSVTRAVPFSSWKAGKDSFGFQDAINLLQKKLRSLKAAKRQIKENLSFKKSVLHIWCSSERIAQVVATAAHKLKLDDNHVLFEDVAILLTVTDFGECKLRYTYIYSGAS